MFVPCHSVTADTFVVVVVVVDFVVVVVVVTRRLLLGYSSVMQSALA